MDELHTWLTWVEQWAKGDDSRELIITREENRERCKFLRLASTFRPLILIQYNHNYNTIRSLPLNRYPPLQVHCCH